MARKTELKGQTVKNSLLKFPNISKHALAKKIYKENNILFQNVEDARTLINYYTGSKRNGKVSNPIKSFNEILNELKKEMPKGETDKIEPYHLPKSQRRVLLLSDCHIPYHSDIALEAALKFGNQKEVDTIWLNGDIMDVYQLSRFEKDPRKRDFKYERDVTRLFLKKLRQLFPKALIIYKIGNHDVRYEKIVMQKCAEIYDEEVHNLGELLKLHELNIQLIQSKQFAYAGKLPVLHGHELPMKSGGDNPANLSKKRLGKQAIFGHFHKTTTSTGREFDKGMSYQIYSTGSLCDLHPDYMPINEWNWGFAYIEVDANGNYVVQNLTIGLDGKIY